MNLNLKNRVKKELRKRYEFTIKGLWEYLSKDLKKVFKLHANNYTIEEIAKKCEISEDKVREILE